MIEKSYYKNSSAHRSLSEESIRLLEWDNLKAQLASFASTKMGENAILESKIPTEYEISRRLLQETIEINELEKNLDKSISFSGVFDISKNIEICSKGGVINSSELLEIAETISAAKDLKKILLDFEQRPFISSFLNRLIDHNQIEKILKIGIESNGRISDRASQKLAKLRQELLSKKSERRILVDKFIQKNTNYIQDTIIGDRYGRPVLAIKVQFAEKFKGIIHDSSASGNTIYLEPESIVFKGNKIASMEARVAGEEFKLLKEWSQIISDNDKSLIDMSDILLRTEHALTRSRYSNWIGGYAPIVENNPIVKLIGFSHPLLIWENKKKEAPKPVSIDFHINRNTKVVAITGPNTGGKTVALKGLGIALLMARSGLFIPSIKNPIIPFCPNIFVDIGDDQSLEGNLSTFSGHILRIRNILESLNNKKGLSVVLLDEIGSGTDPSEGTALAIALLKEFATLSDITLATTHYGDIKALKYSDNRFENVSVAFDEESFKPKYTLNWGIPGRSNALSISRRIGIDEKILNEAANYLKPKEVENINILKQLFTLLEPYGYIDYQLLESKDKRGIDTAYISKYQILSPKLHYIKFSSKFQTKDTRPIFEATLKMQKSTVKIYNAHFPSNYYDLQMRIESFEALRDLHRGHQYPSIAFGDFNVSSKDDNKYRVYENQSKEWHIAHIDGCYSCKGTYYFNSGNSWDFLDSIFISKNRGISFDVSSIKVHKTKSNTYKDSGKPYRFDPKLKKGVSDHFAMVAKINI